MVDLVDQLREVKDHDFHADSLRTMVLWGADEIERLRAALKSVEIALARDESIDAAMKIILAARTTEQKVPGAQCVAKAYGGEWCVGRCLEPRDCSETPRIWARGAGGNAKNS